MSHFLIVSCKVQLMKYGPMLTNGTKISYNDNNTHSEYHSISVLPTFLLWQMISDSDPGETDQWLGFNDVLMGN